MKNIIDGLYILESSPSSHVFYINDEKRILIDTGLPSSASEIVKELHNHHIDKIDIILLTHHDVDHVGGAYKLQKEMGSEVYISKEDYPYLCKEKDRPGIKKVLAKCLHIKPPLHVKIIDCNYLYGVQAVKTPGHTPGHMAFGYHEVLISGDLFQNKNGILSKSPKIFTYDNARNAKSLKTILSGRYRWICPAHGDIIKYSDSFKQRIYEIIEANIDENRRNTKRKTHSDDNTSC